MHKRGPSLLPAPSPWPTAAFRTGQSLFPPSHPTVQGENPPAGGSNRLGRQRSACEVANAAVEGQVSAEALPRKLPQPGLPREVVFRLGKGKNLHPFDLPVRPEENHDGFRKRPHQVGVEVGITQQPVRTSAYVIGKDATAELGAGLLFNGAGLGLIQKEGLALRPRRGVEGALQGFVLSEIDSREYRRG